MDFIYLFLNNENLRGLIVQSDQLVYFAFCTNENLWKHSRI